MTSPAPATSSADAFTHYLQYLQQRQQAGTPVEVRLDHFCFRATVHPSSPDPPRYILRDITGTLKPGTMTLVLGPPQCGKTALLKSIAGVFHFKGEGATSPHTSGTITYNGRGPHEIHVEDCVTFVGQTDEHIPTLTVRETLEFAHACRGPSESDAWRTSAPAILDAIGLASCANTRVGNEMIRGISGGQRRRVSLGEMLTGRSSILLLDEFTTGLDTTVALDLTKKLRDMCSMLNYTLVCTLLQPPPEVFALFDNVVLLHDGHVAYSGTRAHAVDYFGSIGFFCPPRVDVAEFIQQVTTDLGPTYRQHDAPSSTNEIPTTPEAFYKTFEAAAFPHKLSDVPVNAGASAAPMPHKFRKTIGAQFALVFARQIKLVGRDKRFNKVRVGQNSVFGLIIGSLFWQMGTTPAATISKAGLFFLTILFTSVITISNIAYTIEVRNIYIKQSYFQFYPAVVYALSESILEFVATLVQVFLFTSTSYWMCGFSNADGGTHYGLYYTIVFLNSVSICQLFKCCGAVASTKTTGLIAAASLIFIELVFSGYAVHESVFPIGLKWLYWLNPASWAYRALFQNEFASPLAAYDAPHPFLRFRMGNYYMALMGVSQDLSYRANAVLYLVSFYIAMIAATALAYHVLKHEPHRASSSLRPPKAKFALMAPRERRASVQLVATEHPVDFTPTTLSFRHLHYHVPVTSTSQGKNKYTTVELLHDIHGHFRPHTLTALMGSSGAGKSTLLDVLAGRKNSGKVTGELFLNGQTMTSADQRRFGYVEQSDLHCMKTTVGEAFEFSARLRLPESAQRNAKTIIQSTVALLELKPERDKMLSLLSGEQMKRVTIGVELVANPSVLFLYVGYFKDEPTSGLAVHAANVVMEAVKRIALAGRTVICTIHQPSLALFELFDDLILLQTGGRQVYCGPLGAESSDLLEYFESVSRLIRKCDETENPATYMLEVMPKHPDIDFAAVYTASTLCQRNLKAIDAMAQQGVGTPVVIKSSEGVHGGFATSFVTQFRLVLSRMVKKYWRTTEYSFGRVGVALFVSLVLGFLFSSNGLGYTGDVDSQMGLVFIAPLFMGVISVITGLPVVDSERMVYFREHASGMYAPLPYSLAVGLVELPYVVVNSTVFVVVFYNMVGLYATADAFAWFFVLFFFYTLYATYLGQFLVIALPDLRTATVVSGALNSIFSIFSGFFIHRDDIPAAWKLLYWISPLHYMMEGVMVTQFFQNNHNVTLGSASTGALSPTPVTVAAHVEGQFGGTISYANRYNDLAALLVWIAILRVANGLSLRYISHVHR
ncbi:Aste57867_237 [Aphanomyces stellatus]|uniref:Aste57867_237 protein n=1 Tax=Aphanomyces stellatus TaxID=120398 RepID=A0A485K556_9STRA|nr:hypothetical protein As57867_000237 [Aphanomyces stellatus]VFT77463.1 Aste57867_237 [Aphanomyces stellatus]